MSAESGVPTYRGAGGIWKSYDYQHYACQRAFDRDPAKVWEFHNFRRELVARCQPNRGHDIITRAAAMLPDVCIVTQNIDGLHARAGATTAHELHGNLFRVRCPRCLTKHQDPPAPRSALQCPTCRSWWRPDIVWFEDFLDDDVVTAATTAIENCELLVSVGTSAVVYPAAALPQYAAANGAVCVEINPEPTPASHLYSVHLRGPATTMLARLAEGLSE